MDNVSYSEYVMEEVSGFLLDQEDLEIDREYTGILPDKVIQTGLCCPRCESFETMFSVDDYLGHLHEDWVCLKCRLIFTPSLAWVFSQLRDNDKEDNCE